MKTTEIKIGDLVQLVTGNETEYVKVSFIDKDDTIEINDTQGYVMLKDVRPIPLTAEILEKNGWKKKDTYYVKGNISVKFYKYNDTIVRIIDLYTDNYLIWHEINAVHQLQHILWALGINDDLRI